MLTQNDPDHGMYTSTYDALGQKLRGNIGEISGRIYFSGNIGTDLFFSACGPFGDLGKCEKINASPYSVTGLPLLICFLYLASTSKPIGDYGTHELMVIAASIAMSVMMAGRVKDAIKQLRAR